MQNLDEVNGHQFDQEFKNQIKSLNDDIHEIMRKCQDMQKENKSPEVLEFKVNRAQRKQTAVKLDNSDEEKGSVFGPKYEESEKR